MGQHWQFLQCFGDTLYIFTRLDLYISYGTQVTIQTLVDPQSSFIFQEQNSYGVSQYKTRAQLVALHPQEKSLLIHARLIQNIEVLCFSSEKQFSLLVLLNIANSKLANWQIGKLAIFGYLSTKLCTNNSQSINHVY